MKVIGRTQYGYICEVGDYELATLVGNRASAERTTFPIGAILEVEKTFQHVSKLLRNEESRRTMAEQLRAAATVLETTPSVLTLPEPADDDGLDSI